MSGLLAVPELIWQVSIAVPFSYAASKNRMWVKRRDGQMALRSESRALRDEITLRSRAALAGVQVAHNKLWLDIFVQKPNHHGDAINVVDLVCDGLKAALPVDDRWFCLRRLDWEIVHSDPQLFLTFGQESAVDCQVCSRCGHIQPLDQFPRRKSSSLGVDRICRACRKASRNPAGKEVAHAP